MPRLYQSLPLRSRDLFEALTKPNPLQADVEGSPERTAWTTRSGSVDSASGASVSGAVASGSSDAVASAKVSGAVAAGAAAALEVGAVFLAKGQIEPDEL